MVKEYSLKFNETYFIAQNMVYLGDFVLYELKNYILLLLVGLFYKFKLGHVGWSGCWHFLLLSGFLSILAIIKWEALKSPTLILDLSIFLFSSFNFLLFISKNSVNRYITCRILYSLDELTSLFWSFSLYLGNVPYSEINFVLYTHAFFWLVFARCNLLYPFTFRLYMILFSKLKVNFLYIAYSWTLLFNPVWQSLFFIGLGHLHLMYQYGWVYTYHYLFSNCPYVLFPFFFFWIYFWKNDSYLHPLLAY